jgi:hypothetical protein
MLSGTPKGVNHPNDVGEALIPSIRPYLSSFSCVLLLSILALPPVLEAQTIPSPFRYLERRQEVGVFYGHMGTSTGRFDYGPRSGSALGLRYGLELAGPVSLEAVTGVVNSTRNVVDPSRVEGDRIIGTADSRIAVLDARLKFSFVGRRSWHGISPFLVGGGGIAFDTSGRSELDDVLLPEDVFDFGSSFFGTLGVGNRWFLTESIALRGDAIFSLWKVDTPPGFSEPSRGFEAVENGEWLRGSTFSLSLLYRW